MASKTTDWRPGPTVCRCCLTEGCYKDISTEYFWMGKREVYAEVLSETFSLSIAYSQSGGPNSNSRLICEPCISRLRDASDFRRQVQECEKTFTQYLDPATAVVELDAPLVTADAQVKVERVKIKKEASDDDFDDRPDFNDADDDDDDLDDQPLTKLASKVPKKESVDLMDLLDNAKAGEKRKSTTKTKTPAAKKAKGKKEAKATTSKAPKPEKKKKGSADVKVSWTRKQLKKYNDRRDNAAIIIEYSNAFPFRWRQGLFKCAFCPLKFVDMNAVKEHSLEHPNKLEAMRYARTISNIKIDVADLKCTICNLNMRDLDTLKDHLIIKHRKPIKLEFENGVIPYISDGKAFICTHCGEKFDLFTNINIHINQHYPNNICPECGKGFSASDRLKAHLIMHKSERNSAYKCTKCGQVFPTSALKSSHMTTAHKPKHRYRCPYCEQLFKEYRDRTRHLKEAHGRKVEYPCNLCSSVFPTCNQRTQHIRQVHIRIKKFSCTVCPSQFVTRAELANHMVKHGGEKNFQCEVCKKAYPRMKSLKEHMRIHNNDKRFVCKYCNHAFVQKCSLKSHLRAHHPDADPLD